MRQWTNKKGILSKIIHFGRNDIIVDDIANVTSRSVTLNRGLEFMNPDATMQCLCHDCPAVRGAKTSVKDRLVGWDFILLGASFQEKQCCGTDSVLRMMVLTGVRLGQMAAARNPPPTLVVLAWVCVLVLKLPNQRNSTRA